MRQARGIALSVVALASVLLAPAAWAQQASGVAGVVRDTSGGVLPGVTVEAASPALIEKVRSVVTDNEGRYSIVDLRPGTYVVTFTLPGFSTFRREGVVLTAGFTGTVNADMQVGALEETITVTGEAPLVDTQNVRRQSVVSRELLESLPTGGKGLQTLVVLNAGMKAFADVGGSTGAYSSSNLGSTTIHGKSGIKTQYDGMRVDHAGGANLGYIPNSLTSEEMTLETSGGLAESDASGGVANMIPKEGANTFRGTVPGVYTNRHLQSHNLDDMLRARGLITTDSVRTVYDAGVTLGGPIKRDRLWFYTVQRWWGSRGQIANMFWNKTQGTPFYTPDFDRPGLHMNTIRDHALRLTWQVSAKHKVNVFLEPQDLQRQSQSSTGSLQAPEATNKDHFYNGLYQVNWSWPATNRLLLDAGAGLMKSNWPWGPLPGVSVSEIPILEQSTNFKYNANSPLSWTSLRLTDRPSQRFSVSYVTGSHAFKAGFQLSEGSFDLDVLPGSASVGYRFLRGVPVSLDQVAVPYGNRQRIRAELGVYVQDRWTVKRLALNYGLRFDYFNVYVPEQHFAAGPFVPARDFAPVYRLPEWTDLNPRLGAAYDLFGNGRTALKASVGRYVNLIGAGIASDNNPMVTSVNSVNRPWNDANKNYVPDCDLTNFGSNGECGPINNQNFGKNNPLATRWDDKVLHGFGVRDYLWDVSAEVQHQLTSSVSVTAGYYRNWSGNFRLTDNLDVTPADHSPYCITAPVDARLPGGGGYQVCGLYNISPAKFGKFNNLVTDASQYGKRTQVSDFINGSVSTRFGLGIVLGGGVDTGRTVTDNCFAVDSPQQLLHCRVVTPPKGQTQVKAFGSFPLPGDFAVSGIFQVVPGPVILADYAATTAEIAPSLGRNLAGGTRTATVPLIKPQTQFEARRKQLDLRLTKVMKLGSRMRLQANLDVYNAFNANPIIGINTQFGPSWLQPAGQFNAGGSILQARLVQLSGQLSF